MDKVFPTDMVVKYAQIIGSHFVISYGSSLACHFSRIFEVIPPFDLEVDSDLWQFVGL